MPELEPDTISISSDGVELTQAQIDELAATDKTYRQIEAEYGEEVAINVGIARDPDAPELTDEWFANAFKWMADNPEIVEQMKNAKFRWPAKEWANLPIDHDLLDHFRQGGPDWHTRLNDTLRQAVFSSDTPFLGPEPPPELLMKQQPAVDIVRLPGDERRIIPGQKGD